MISHSKRGLSLSGVAFRWPPTTNDDDTNSSASNRRTDEISIDPSSSGGRNRWRALCFLFVCLFVCLFFRWRWGTRDQTTTSISIRFFFVFFRTLVWRRLRTSRPAAHRSATSFYGRVPAGAIYKTNPISWPRETPSFMTSRISGSCLFFWVRLISYRSCIISPLPTAVRVGSFLCFVCLFFFLVFFLFFFMTRDSSIRSWSVCDGAYCAGRGRFYFLDYDSFEVDRRRRSFIDDGSSGLGMRSFIIQNDSTPFIPTWTDGEMSVFGKLVRSEFFFLFGGIALHRGRNDRFSLKKGPSESRHRNFIRASPIKEMSADRVCPLSLAMNLLNEMSSCVLIAFSNDRSPTRCFIATKPEEEKKKSKKMSLVFFFLF